MRLLVASAILAVPALAMGQDPIPEPVLTDHYRSCVSECTQNRQEGYCTQVCGCVTEEMRQHMTADDLEARAARLSENANDAQVNDEVKQMVAYCASQVGQ